MNLIRKCTNCGNIGKRHNYLKTVTIRTTCPKCHKKTFIARS